MEFKVGDEVVYKENDFLGHRNFIIHKITEHGYLLRPTNSKEPLKGDDRKEYVEQNMRRVSKLEKAMK